MSGDPLGQPEPAVDRTGRSPLLSTVVAVLAVVALVAGVVVLLVDDRDGDEDGLALVAGAPAALRDAGSARMTMTMTMEGAGFELELNGEGTVDFVTGAGTFAMSVFGLQMEVRTDGETVWMNVPPELAGTDAGWLAVPAELMAGQPDLPTIDTGTGVVEALRGIGAEIEELGEEEIAGVDTTHYRGVIRLRDAIASSPEALRDQTEAALQQFEELGAAEMPVDIWLSDDGLPVRQVMTFETPATPDSFMPTVEVRMQVDLTDFGAPVQVEPPPADQVVVIEDVGRLREIFGGGGVVPQDPAEQPAA